MATYRHKTSDIVPKRAMALRSATILFRDRPAGALCETATGGTRFVYNADWSETIGCSLPRAEGEHAWSAGIHPFFQHLTAEGWLRGQQARAGHVQAQDDFGLLTRFGADCIGAVGVVPATESGPEPLRETLEAADAVVTGRRTVSGVQKKLLAFHDGERFRPAERLDQPATHIAKFNPDGEPTIVRNENLSLSLAREVLGDQEVTRATIGTVEGIDGVALLVERFDRRDGTKLRLEDFAQILRKPRGLDFKGKYQSSYEEAASVVRDFSARPVIDLARFLRRIVFSVLIGDADAHLKNFSLLERPEGLRLSPAYDQLNTTIYDNYDRDAALEINGRLRALESIDRSTLTELGRVIGLPGGAANRVVASVQAGWERSTALALGPAIDPQDFRARYAELVTNNAARIFT